MLQVFKSLPVVREIYRAADLSQSAASYPRDVVTLGWEERLKARSRRRSDGGLEFATALPRGTVLRDGDCLILEELRTVIEVRERAEPVFVVDPKTQKDWARFAYAIGNSHQPLALTEASIVCPDIPGMEQVLEYHGIPFRRGLMPFTPLGLGTDPYSPGHQHTPVAR